MVLYELIMMPWNVQQEILIGIGGSATTMVMGIQVRALGTKFRDIAGIY